MQNVELERLNPGQLQSEASCVLQESYQMFNRVRFTKEYNGERYEESLRRVSIATSAYAEYVDDIQKVTDSFEKAKQASKTATEASYENGDIKRAIKFAEKVSHFDVLASIFRSKSPR
ncbi:MAG: hypothetical protein A3A51_02635 [Candidatus Levybacteria bacterium RIFCSPLOWO2_01_FULL_39_10]|nr:MAG: hypothetical protein A3A51_02635 [Candidatus Levybacteria bacterium RIFCSPLOWO2_01_FULL_39_10]